MMRMVTNLHEAELERRVRELSMPILVMLGDHDELLRPHYLNRWRDIGSSAKTLLIAGAAHDIQNTEPERFVDALLALHATALN